VQVKFKLAAVHIVSPAQCQAQEDMAAVVAVRQVAMAHQRGPEADFEAD